MTSEEFDNFSVVDKHKQDANCTYHTTTTTVLRPFFRDHPGEPVPEENF